MYQLILADIINIRYLISDIMICNIMHPAADSIGNFKRYDPIPYEWFRFSAQFFFLQSAGTITSGQILHFQRWVSIFGLTLQENKSLNQKSIGSLQSKGESDELSKGTSSMLRTVTA